MSKLKEAQDFSFQEELAKTYFPSAPSKENYFTQSSLLSKDNKKSMSLIFPLGIAGIVLVVLVIFFAFNRVEIKISPAYTSGTDTQANAGDVLYLAKDGELNRDLVENVVFYEDADANSGWKKGVVSLSNDINFKKAAFGMDFKKPVDMSQTLFFFNAKGKSGGEEFRIGLQDAHNNSCYSKINTLQNSWQSFQVDLGQVQGLVDPRSITHVDFTINPGERPNLSRTQAYFKDLYLTKRRE